LRFGKRVLSPSWNNEESTVPEQTPPVEGYDPDTLDLVLDP
jgi:hypothetical protein